MLFTAEHEEVRRSLQKFIASEINPFVDEWEAAGGFPAHELFKKLGDLGGNVEIRSMRGIGYILRMAQDR